MRGRLEEFGESWPQELSRAMEVPGSSVWKPGPSPLSSASVCLP